MRIVPQARRANRPDDVFARPAFTLIELLVVVGIVTILASLLLSALGLAKRQARISECLNNKRQLILAWLMYAQDWNDHLVHSEPDFGPAPGWCYGVLDWSLWYHNTNTEALADPKQSALAAYVRSSVHVYRCPEDHYLSPIQRQAGWRFRINSTSMNNWVAPSHEEGRRPIIPKTGGLKIFDKMGDFSKPASIFILLDVHPDELRYPFFKCAQAFAVLVEGRSNLYPLAGFNIPGSLHNGGGVLAYADGSVSLKKWQDAATKLPVKYEEDYWANDTAYWEGRGPNKDYEWLGRHATEFTQ